MCMRMLSVPLSPEMKEKLVGSKTYQIRYDVERMEDTVSDLVETQSYDDFMATLKLVLDRTWATVTHIRIGDKLATLQWSETIELPDSPI